MSNNPLHQAIYDKIVKPEMDKKIYDVDGIVIEVNYYEQTGTVMWNNPKSGVPRYSKNVYFPKDADGIYRQGLQIGDKVKLAFRNGDHQYPYVSVVYANASTKDSYFSRNAGGLPKGMPFL